MSYADLAAQCGPRPSRPAGRILPVEVNTGDIAYNPSRQFKLFAPALGRDVDVMYVRVESRESAAVSRLLPQPGTYDPRSVLYWRAEHCWLPADADELGVDGRSFVLELTEDPFVSFIGDEIVVGGVVIDFSTARAAHEPIAITDPSRFDYSLATPTVTVVLRRGRTLDTLERFAEVRGMREVRLVQLSDGSILVATRPHGGAAGLGTIGFTRLARLDDLDQSAADAALLMPSLVTRDIKTGPNELYLLPGATAADDEVGVLAHAAFRDARFDLHYLATAFRVRNPNRCDSEPADVTPLRVVGCRSDWHAAPIKRPTLEDVVFPSALTRRDGRATLLAGLSDAAIGELDVADPFANS